MPGSDSEPTRERQYSYGMHASQYKESPGIYKESPPLPAMYINMMSMYFMYKNRIYIAKNIHKNTAMNQKSYVIHEWPDILILRHKHRSGKTGQLMLLIVIFDTIYLKT